MKRILFVDDEPRILDGLRRVLRGEDWDMSFAGSGAEALALLDAMPVDVVVTDFRMPGMDGAQLLEQVQDRFPATARFVLSGHFEKEGGLRAGRVAHQVLAKPCEPRKLHSAIARVCALMDLLPNDVTRRVSAALGAIPGMPRVYAGLCNAMERKGSSVDSVARVVEQDGGITAKVLELASSSLFGAAPPVTSISALICTLGFDILKQLVLAAELLHSDRLKTEVSGFSIQRLQKHSLLVARIANLIAPPELSNAAALAGLLHDVGELVLAQRLPKECEKAGLLARTNGSLLHMAERDTIGASHQEIGAFLLGLWGLPQPVVEGVLYHHSRANIPAYRGEAALDTGAIVRIADALAHEYAPAPEVGLVHDSLDDEFMIALGLHDRIDSWRARVGQL